MRTMTKDEVFLYKCEAGHEIASGRRRDSCPCYVHGVPCQAAMHRVDASGKRLGKRESVQ